MRNIDEHTITDAVLQSLAATPDARLKQIMTSLVTHLHDFVREVKLTEDEWQAGIDFLTGRPHLQPAQEDRRRLHPHSARGGLHGAA